MEFRSLGQTGLSVSVMSVGSWLTLDHIDAEAGLEVLRAAIDSGVNFFDDARYDDRTGKAPIKTGYSEVVFGELFKKGGWSRDDVIIANKAWLEFFPDETVAEETQGSLVRLRMDALDITYVVPPPKELPMEELVEQMNDLVVAGTLRSWGGLNWRAELIRAANKIAREEGYAPFSAVQLPYNLLYRGPVEGEAMRETCQEEGVSVVASYVLAGGLLTNKYASGLGQRPDRLSTRQLTPFRKKGMLTKCSRLAGIARELTMTPAQLALAYCLKGPNVASVLFGATSPEQLEENLGAIEAQAKLDDGALKDIRAALKKKIPS